MRATKLEGMAQQSYVARAGAGMFRLIMPIPSSKRKPFKLKLAIIWILAQAEGDEQGGATAFQFSFGAGIELKRFCFPPAPSPKTLSPLKPEQFH